jgi:subtilisin family serine protease
VIRPTTIVISIAAAMAVALLWHFGMRPHAPQPAADTVVERSQPRADLPAFRDVNAPVPMPRGRDVAVPLPDFGDGALTDDYVVQFRDRAALEAFLQRISGGPLVHKGTIAALNAVRVSGPASLVAAMAGEYGQLAANFPVIVPVSPQPREWDLGNLAPFGSTVAAFLGIPADADLTEWGSGVKVAILDTGVLAHEALGGRSIAAMDLLSGEDAGAWTGHGTAVAGLIASGSAFAPGIAPAVDLLSIRVLDGQGRGDVFTLAQGIIEAVDRGAAIINMSLGSYGQNAILSQAVQYAHAAGVLMVASSGNDGQDGATWPAAYPEVIGVAAVDASGTHAPFSNSGTGVDISGPGFRIHALWGDDTFVYFDGTSAAAPLVAGMAAELLSRGLAASPHEAGQLLLATANDAGLPGHDASHGAGILNAQRALEVATPGIVDIAIADFYPQTAALADGSFPLHVSFQNRGTETVRGAVGEIAMNGSVQRFQLGTLAPGESVGLQLPVAAAPLNNGAAVEVSARVTPPANVEDMRPENNAGKVTLSRILER